ncbi:ATP-binding protein [Kordiimonas aquimaris]|uniref:ATP-binding protein n=1 Tax=Kordiimonas aquimaris TaxID=707591 RepID=UPI0021D0279E|nr:ATP-binding protein [Kordiimonas aquimaris]
MSTSEEQMNAETPEQDMRDSISAAKIRAVVGELYYRQFSILLALTAAYYVLVTVKDFLYPHPELSWILNTANLAVLGLLATTFFMEKKGIINADNIYLTPIPISIAMVINVHCHVIIYDDVNMMLRGLLLIVAFGIVSLLPWIFWLLVPFASLFYFGAAYSLLGNQSGPLIVLGVGASMISYAGFAVRHNSVLEQIRLTLVNQERAQKMEQLARAKDEFVANMSHELRTPLTGLMGMVDLLEDAPLRPIDKHHLMTAKSSAETLRVVIDDILDLSKLNAGKLKLKDTPFELGLLASEVSEMMSVAAAKKSIGLALKLPLEDIPFVIGDQARLRQILFNLTGNAVKFTSKGEVVLSLILLDLADDAITVRFQVEDTGVGIAPDDMARLFDRFEQIDSSATRGHAGTGLGLAISQELAQLMGGRVQAESTLGKGSVFWVDLVLKRAPADAVAMMSVRHVSEEAPSQKSTKPMHVLIAEDNPVNQMLIGKLVEKASWKTTFVNDGEAALDAALKTPFDLILMDIQMPKMSGDVAAEEIRKRSGCNQKTPILALTANCLSEDVERYMDSGMNDVIAKPIKLELFYQTISQHMPS